MEGGHARVSTGLSSGSGINLDETTRTTTAVGGFDFMEDRPVRKECQRTSKASSCRYNRSI